MLAPYSLPSGGFVSLFPFVDYGDDLAMALYRVGIKSGNHISPSFGFGVVFELSGKCVRLDERDEHDARVAATGAAMVQPVTLVRAVARGRVTLWQRMERIELASTAVASNFDGYLVAPNGTLLSKAQDVYNPVDFRALSRRLVGQLRAIDRKLLKPRLDRMLERLDVNWERMTTAQVRTVFADANKFLRGAAIQQALPQWQTKVNATLTTVARGARRQIRDTFLPRLNLAYRRPEVKTLERLSNQQGWFIRDRQKVISQALTDRGNKIVIDGLAKGLGRNEIGRRLFDQLPEMWKGMGRQYANVVAANAVSRVRSYAELTSYSAAGIELLEVQAVLDERTTEVCRFMDGQVISVSSCLDLSQRAANITNPDDIYTVSPFMDVVHTKHGDEIHTRNGDRIAGIERSGLGKVDDRGQHKAYQMGRQLPDKSVGPPPYHHACRSTTVPRMDSWNVPRSFQMRSAMSGSVIRPVVNPPSAVRTPRLPAGLPPGLFLPDRARQRVHVAPDQRPVDLYPSPVSGHPTALGDRLPVDDMTVPREFFSDPPLYPYRRAEVRGSFRTITRNPDGTRAFVMGRDTSFKPFTEAEWARVRRVEEDILLANVGEQSSVLVQMGVRSSMGSQDLAALAVNPNLAGREVVFRITTKTGGDEFFKVIQNKAGRRELNKAATQLRNGTWTEKEASAWLNRAKRDGWVKYGRKLDDVSTAAIDRVSVTPVVPQRKALPKVEPKTKPVPKRPEPTPKRPAKPPKTTTKPDPFAGLKDKTVNPEIYYSRPDPKKMVDATWRGEHGYIQTMNVKGRKVTAGRWRQIQMDRRYEPSIDFSKLQLTDSDHVVNLFNAGYMNKRKFGRMYTRIVEEEMRRGFTGVREYIIHDAQGQTLFIRWNGAYVKKIGEKTINIWLENAVAPNEWARELAIGDLRRSGLAESTTTLKQFYPKAKVDWSRGNLVPGVELDKQVARRVKVVRQEIDDKIAAMEIEKGRKLNGREIGQILVDTMRQGASKLKPSQHLHNVNPQRSKKRLIGREYRQQKLTSGDSVKGKYVVESETTVNKALDSVLVDAGDGIMMALQTKPLPRFMSKPNVMAWYAHGEGVGASARPSSIVLSAERSPTLAFGKDASFGAQSVFRHEFQHHLDTIGMNGSAARILRNRQITGGKPVNIYKGTAEFGVPGKFTQAYESKVYGTDRFQLLLEGRAKKWRAGELRSKLNKKVKLDLFEGREAASEFMSVMAQDAVGSGTSELLRVHMKYKRSPEQFAGYVAMMRGAFVPF